MKLPFLRRTLNADAIIYTSELDEDSKPIEAVLFSGRVNHVKKTKQVINADRQLIQLSGWLVIPGKIEIPLNKSLIVEIEGRKYKVFSTNQPDNPDGTIFSTEVFLV